MAASVKKKPSSAQLAARKRFAAMAKSGAFKRKAGTARRKKVATKATVKRRVTKAPSPAQLAARAKFVAMVRAKGKGRAKAKGKGTATKKNSKAKHTSYFGTGTGLKLRKHPTAQGPWHVSGDKTRRKKRLVKKVGKGLGRLFNPGTTKRNSRGFSSAAPSWTRLPAKRKVRKRKVNPSPASVFSEFRGKDVRSKSKAIAATGTPKVLAALGALRELKVNGKTLHFGGKATLAADGRKRLHIVGTRFKKPNPPGEVDFGSITSVTYYSDKPIVQEDSGDDPKAKFNYVHRFERSKPRLIVDEEGFGIIEGGSYTITDAGIEG